MEGYGKRILVVDDEEHIRVLLCLLLEQDGYNVHIATDGEEALDEMMKRRFDIVLTDFDMPGVTALAYSRSAASSVLACRSLSRQFRRWWMCESEVHTPVS